MRAAIVGVAVLCAACSKPLTPDETVMVTASENYSPAQAPGASAPIAAAYYDVDPIAPNWEIVEGRLADNRYRIAMRKKRWTTGGDGEAIELLHRRAERLAQAQGYRDYRILSWTEGVQSDMPIAQRWARGEVELVHFMPPEPDPR
jgi:hypothetical protein